ncbi:MAG: GMC oxidoreductase [Acidobacteriota bacterium]|nr:GMC oxidoreductase [Acidobacteriota bacterium]
MIEEADVVIVGSGIAGAAVHRSLQGAGLRILVLEAGPALSAGNTHLRNLLPYDDGSWRGLVSAMARPPVRAGGQPVEDTPPAGPSAAVRSDQRAEEGLPGYGNCCGIGGNGLIWSGIVLPPTSTAGSGVSHEALEEAAAWLGAGIVADSPRQAWLQEAHGLTPVPLAWSAEEGWHGPRQLAGAGFHPRAVHSVRRIVHERGRALGVEARPGGAADDSFIAARHIVIAAGVVGTTRLLWASGLGRDLPGLGQGIVNHPVAVAQVAVPQPVWSRLANHPQLSRPAAARVLPAPAGGHTLVLAEPAWMMENRVDARATLSVYAYATLDRHASRRLSFVPEQLGPDGLSLPRFEFPPSEEERACEERALGEARAWAAKLGRVLPSGRPRVLPRGADQHLSGGASIGPPDDPLSVAEPSGKIRSLENVWVAGAAVLPEAVSTHPAQTIVALAARTGRAVTALLIKD